MVGLVGEGFVFALQVALPGFHLAEQGVEVTAQAVEFGDFCRRYAAVEVAFAAGGVGHGGEALQRAGDAAQQASRQVQGDPRAEGGADEDPGQAAEQEAQQATAVADEMDAADGSPLVKDRLADGLFEQRMRQLQFHTREQAGIRAYPLRQQLAIGIEDFGLGHLFGGGNQAEGFGGCGAVVEHHHRFHGVVDGARDQVQVVFGIHPQRQHTQQGQGHAGQGHGQQREDQMPSADDRAQRRSHLGAAHCAGARRRDSCKTLG